LERTEGNIQAMQVMLILNELNLFSGKQNAIGEIRIINSSAAKEISPSNEELLYNWALLNNYSPVKNDKFKSGNIKFLDKYHLLFQELSNIMTWARKDEFKSLETKDFAALDSCVLEYQRTI
jgi:hypothetical protein